MRITKWVIATGFALAMTHILFVHIVCSYIPPGRVPRDAKIGFSHKQVHRQGQQRNVLILGMISGHEQQQ